MNRNRTKAFVLVCMMAAIATSANAQESSRADFDEWCDALEGRWVGDVTWVADWPGLGKKGEKVTAYFEGRRSDDGAVMLGRFYGGEGSGTWLSYHDAGAKRIKTVWITSGGSVSNSLLYKEDGKWIEKASGSLANGTKTTYVGVVTISDGGDKHTWTGSGTVGSEKTDDQHDVWRRVSK